MARLTVLIVAVVLAFLMAAPMPGVTAKKYTVGENKFWNPKFSTFLPKFFTFQVSTMPLQTLKVINVVSIETELIHITVGDFVFDRNQHNILEVNKTDYESCISDHPIRNWTRGAGRDIVTLNQTKHYYLLDGKGGCYGGMKLAVKVEKLPPPPKAAPVKSLGSVSIVTGLTQFMIPVSLFAFPAMWDAISMMW